MTTAKQKLKEKKKPISKPNSPAKGRTPKMPKKGC